MTFPTYQLRATLHAPGLAPDRQMEAAVRVVLGWASDKLPNPLAGIEELPNPFRLEVDAGTVLETVWRAEARVWSFRLVHPDTGDVRTAVPGRTFTTHGTFLERGGAVEAAVQTLCTQPPAAPRDVDVVRPAFVRRLAAEPGLKDVVPIDGKPVVLTKEAQLADLRALLRNPLRSLPVVVVRRAPAPAPLLDPDTALDDEGTALDEEAALDADAGRDEAAAAEAEALSDLAALDGAEDAAEEAATPEEPDSPAPLDAAFLADKLLGYATVVVLEDAASAALPQKLPADFRVDAGGVRVYQPGMAPEWRDEPHPRHPRFPEESVRYFSVAGADGGYRTGPDAFAEFLVRSVRAGMGQRTVDWRGVPAFPAVFGSFLEDRQNAVGEEDCLACRDTFERRIAALQAEIADLLQQMEFFSDETEKATSEAEVLKQDRFLLEERVRKLTSELEERAEAGTPEEVPTRLSEVAEWARNRFGRRLLLLPRAVRELKDAEYEDVALLCDALRLLADDYYDMRRGLIRTADFTDRAMALGLTWGQSMDAGLAGQYGEAYFVQYPATGRGRRTFLEQHLKKGTSFEPRHCLRIYFFWGEDDQKVVVGSLPRHLPSSAG